jgi:hypothetical protein
MANNFDLKKYLKEGKLHENNEYKESINITPQQKSDFINQIKSFMEDEDFNTAMRNAGSILARILTNDEAEFIEDVEDFGYDPSEVEDYAEDLVGNLNRGKLQENKDNMPWYISDLLQTVKDGRLSPEDVDYLINQLKLASKKEGTPSDSNISKESIISKANSTDAEGFQQFLEDNDITHEWNEVTVGDFNNGIYDVYLDDFDMPVRYISGKYSPEEDM